MPGIACIITSKYCPVNKAQHAMLEVFRQEKDEVREVFQFKNVSVGVIEKPTSIAFKKSVWLAIEGNLINLNEIQEKLKKSGRIVDKLSIAEILILAYEEWEENFVKHLNGSFAIILYDKTKHQIFAFRDHIGMKNLYWYQDEKQIVVATELKAIATLDFIPQTPYNEGLGAYLYMGFIPQDLSPIYGINKLLPSSYLQVTSIIHRLTLHQYWSFCDCALAKKIISEEAVTENLDRYLQQAIAKQLQVSSGNIGCFLFGGLGSATSAYYLKKLLPNKHLQAYTMVFEGENEEDLKASEEIATTLNLPLKTFILNPEELIDKLPLIQWHMDEPTADPHAILSWHLADKVKSETQTIFSGMGCDELVAGNLRYSANLYYQPLFRWLLHLFHPLLVHAILPLLKQLKLKWAIEMLRNIHYDPWVMEYLKHHALFEHDNLKLLSPILSKFFNPKLFLQKFYSYLKEESDTASFLYFDTQTILTDSYIYYNQRAMTYHNLQWFSPFLENETLRFLIQVPENLKIRNTKTAIPLKNLLRSIFSEPLLNRPKSLRPYFLNKWMFHPKIYELFKLLPRGVLCESGLISQKRLIKEIQNKKKQPYQFLKLWALLNLEIWFRHYINRPVGNPNLDISTKDFLLQ